MELHAGVPGSYRLFKAGYLIVVMSLDGYYFFACFKLVAYSIDSLDYISCPVRHGISVSSEKRLAFSCVDNEIFNLSIEFYMSREACSTAAYYSRLIDTV